MCFIRLFAGIIFVYVKKHSFVEVEVGNEVAVF